MTEPITPNVSLIVPNTGDLVGAWGTSALNPNFQTLDALRGGTTTISLSSATTVFLTVPATTGIWPGTLSQSVNSIIFFSGAQTGNAVIGFSLPGYYIVHNQCTGTASVQLAPGVGGIIGSGNKIGAPPGKKCHVFFDGTNMDYVNMPDPGTAYDLHINTTTLPPWMTACTVAPYVLKDGATYSASQFPALFQLLGSTYGGNGITTFGVPDERNRMRIPVVTGSDPSRVTQAISGINGTTFNSSGGSQSLQAHRHINTLTDPGHSHAITGASVANGVTSGSNPNLNTSGGSYATNAAVTGISITNVTTGAGGSQNMPPAIVSFLALIKT